MSISVSGWLADNSPRYLTELEYLIGMKKGVPYEPRGTIRGFMDLYRAGGIRGLYTGFRLHAMRDTLVRRSSLAAFVFNAEDAITLDRVPGFISECTTLCSWRFNGMQIE